MKAVSRLVVTGCGAAAVLLALVSAPVTTLAQTQRGNAGRGRGGAPATAKEQAPVDLTGYWVTVITEDWRYRMVTAPPGDHRGVPLNAEGNRVANAWDPVKDEAAGEPCKAYGAAGVMRLPGRLHITWQSDNVLKIETEAGTQTRVLTFGPEPSATGTPTLQGVSVASWEFAGRRGRGAAPQGGNLKVVTTHVKPGYLQKNGVPYGEQATVTEYFSRTNEPNGDSWLILTHIVEDPQYLTSAFIRSTHYKKLPDSAASQWSPEPCSAR